LSLIIAKRTIDSKKENSKQHNITSFSSCIHAFQDLDIYNNVLTPCAWIKQTYHA